MIGGNRGGFKLLGCLVVVTLALTVARPAQAQVGSERYASFVMDAQSGSILSAVNPDEPRYPASLTKMMTIYMLFEAIRDRRVTWNEIVPVSAHAASMPPSKLGLLPGTSITVEQALLGLVTKSANDAAAALGELMGGDEERFAQMMTLRARALGMTRTVFRNASGWPDPDQVTTARDLALLARHLIQDYPQEYRYFSVPAFTFHGRYIPNHDRLLQTYPGADGLKTGYIDASGCNLVTSALRGDVRLIGVVLGASNGAERDTHMTSLLDAGFERMGVPIMRPEMVARSRFPSLVAAASAATLPPSTLTRPALRYASARADQPRVYSPAPVRPAPVREFAPARRSSDRLDAAMARMRSRPEPAHGDHAAIRPATPPSGPIRRASVMTATRTHG